MEATTTTLRVQKHKTVELIGVSEGREHSRKEVYDILVGRFQVPYRSIFSFDNLSATQNLTIETIDGNGVLEELVLPENIYEGIIKYLQNSPDISHASDCLGFIVEVLGGNRGNRMVDDGDYSYHGVEIMKGIHELLPGDVISMSDGTEEGWKNCEFHYALYIGNGLFLQKFGKPGALAVTNLEQMKKLYPKLTLIVKLLLTRKKK